MNPIVPFFTDFRFWIFCSNSDRERLRFRSNSTLPLIESPQGRSWTSRGNPNSSGGRSVRLYRPSAGPADPGRSSKAGRGPGKAGSVPLAGEPLCLSAYKIQEKEVSRHQDCSLLPRLHRERRPAEQSGNAETVFRELCAESRPYACPPLC